MLKKVVVVEPHSLLREYRLGLSVALTREVGEATLTENSGCR